MAGNIYIIRSYSAVKAFIKQDVCVFPSNGAQSVNVPDGVTVDFGFVRRCAHNNGPCHYRFLP